MEIHVTQGDANADGFVNLADLGPIINAFRGTPEPGNGDCNGDGFTNLADLGCVITKFRAPPSGLTPTPTPPVCQSPPLNTDFSDIGVFFVDSVNQILIGVSSNGDVATIVLTDIPDSGVELLLEADACLRELRIIGWFKHLPECGI